MAGMGFAVSNFLNSGTSEKFGNDGVKLLFFGALSSFFLCHIWIYFMRQEWVVSKHFDMYYQDGELSFKRLMLTVVRAIMIITSYIGIFSCFYMASLSESPINTGILQAVFASGLIWSILLFYYFFDQSLTP